MSSESLLFLYFVFCEANGVVVGYTGNDAKPKPTGQVFMGGAFLFFALSKVPKQWETPIFMVLLLFFSYGIWRSFLLRSMALRAYMIALWALLIITSYFSASR